MPSSSLPAVGKTETRLSNGIGSHSPMPGEEEEEEEGAFGSEDASARVSAIDDSEEEEEEEGEKTEPMEVSRDTKSILKAPEYAVTTATVSQQPNGLLPSLEAAVPPPQQQAQLSEVPLDSSSPHPTQEEEEEEEAAATPAARQASREEAHLSVSRETRELDEALSRSSMASTGSNDVGFYEHIAGSEEEEEEGGASSAPSPPRPLSSALYGIIHPVLERLKTDMSAEAKAVSMATTSASSLSGDRKSVV